MRPRTNWACVWAVVVTWAFASQLNGEAAEDVLFRSPEATDELPVTLRMEDPKTGLTKSMVLHVKRAMLERYHVTKEEIEKGTVVFDEEGAAKKLMVKGIAFEIPAAEERMDAVVFHSRPDEEPFLLDLREVGGLTIASFEDDPTLVPEPPEAIDWSVPGRRPLTSLALSISARAVVVAANRATEVSNRTAATGVTEQLWLAGAGLHLLVLNPCTAEVTLDKVFPTGEPGAYRDLTWTLANIQGNRIVVVASVHDGSLQLLSSARERLETLGSEWVRYYSFRDSWAWVFIMGGATLGSGFAPNTGTIDTSASPLLMEVGVPRGPSRDRTEGESAGKKAGHEEIKDDKTDNGSHAEGKTDEDLADGQKEDKMPSDVPVTVSEYLTQRQARITKKKPEAEDSDVRETAIGEAAAEESCTEICPSWPPTQEWQHRRAFCATHDGFGDLCRCEGPFVVNQEDAMPRPTTWREDIPILVITGGRIHYLFRLLQSLGKQPGVRRDLILLVTDGYNTEVAKIAHILRLTLLVHRPEGVIPTRISRNVRFGLFNIIKKFPKADKFIVLEDDLILSPDFYSYMQQTSWILENDPSVYCVSAFNHLSYTHTALQRDPDLSRPLLPCVWLDDGQKGPGIHPPEVAAE
ncbi:protein O-linked-mannose beta-1,2-N-acetylglucosaminyltransferase 1-like [Penaeus chinensis]|uniref:protein O-linked-mannose beta-1,2-N-acetylglucosaminyltransferase 1-like n=1 Tax=Penaeus chinensis TaxID=139456 RepID=UPI001FB79FB0|nr:protein O-linked-mannose beta-1,2-N-acetylglucosaminyltransferase 1-like [Penaeus chinensis]XP_047483444.1 protein O-linked-mannose beta-1,2-N-acetylglucosaminyltransferase 1-like [Penaeus chinensis]XP_047483445.1 protein O-linked-mannose beta-1,2-N-acetylglucosaminyltransferase 1-like [Penaeus chinensis]